MCRTSNSAFSLGMGSVVCLGCRLGVMVITEPETADLRNNFSIALVEDASYSSIFWGTYGFAFTMNGLVKVTKPVTRTR